jgi:methionyl-tRNA synthetase
MNEYKTADALAAIMTLAQRSNKYIDETTPWSLAKDEAQLPRLKTVLSNLIEAIRYIGVLSVPFMPETAASILEQIGSPVDTLDSLAQFGTGAARKVGAAKALFARIDEKAMMERINKEIVEPQKAEAAAETAKAAAAEADAESAEKEGIAFLPEINIDDFGKVDLRVGEILTCEKLKKSRKLLKMTVNDGAGTRQILSGISKWYAPEDLIGKKVIFVANLAPAKLAGELSEGMILAADAGDDDVRVMFVDNSIPAGSKIH